jgi:hypothetical protein
LCFLWPFRFLLQLAVDPQASQNEQSHRCSAYRSARRALTSQSFTVPS